MRDCWTEAKALGQVVALCIGHPIAVESVFGTTETVNLLVRVADGDFADALYPYQVGNDRVHVLTFIEQNRLKSLAQVRFTQLIQL